MIIKSSAALWNGLALACGALALVACGGGEKQNTPAGNEAAPGAQASTAPAAPSAPAVAGPSGTAAVSGTVVYADDVPSLKPIDMGADPNCASKHSGPVPNDVLVLGPGKELGNVFVYVKSGLPDNATWAPPTTPVTIDQRGCMYSPHVVGVMVGQPFSFTNSDGLLHNVHALPKQNQEFNIAMPAEVKESPPHKFDQAEGVFQIKCDVHPWMHGFVGVLKSPFFATTGTDGAFTIKNLPAGTYTIEAWHERLGTQDQQVTVADNGTAKVSFTFKKPSAPPA